MCPHCGARSVHRSHRRTWLERALSFFGVFPHRCRECTERFFAFRRAVQGSR